MYQNSANVVKYSEGVSDSCPHPFGNIFVERLFDRLTVRQLCNCNLVLYLLLDASLFCNHLSVLVNVQFGAYVFYDLLFLSGLLNLLHSIFFEARFKATWSFSLRGRRRLARHICARVWSRGVIVAVQWRHNLLFHFLLLFIRQLAGLELPTILLLDLRDNAARQYLGILGFQLRDSLLIFWVRRQHLHNCLLHHRLVHRQAKVLIDHALERGLVALRRR